MRWVLSYILFALLSTVKSISNDGRRLLVVIEDVATKDNYSQFWADLEGALSFGLEKGRAANDRRNLGRGFTLTFESPKSDNVALFKYGERVFDHVILLPPKSKGISPGSAWNLSTEPFSGFGPLLTANLLVQFINQNGNVLLTLSADSPTPSAISSLLLELDIHLPPDRKTVVVDHLNYDTLSVSEKHDVLLLPHPSSPRPDLKNFFEGQGTIAFPRSVPQVLGNDTPHLVPILRAKKTAYSYNPKDEADTVDDPYAVGGQVSLVSAFQARNSARFTVFGSLEALENTWFDAKVRGPDDKQRNTSNREFAKQVSGWTFKETGVLHVGRVEHYLGPINKESLQNNSNSQLEGLNPKIYRIKNDVTFQIELSEYSYGHLSPFTLPPADALQLEFTMLSPFYRLNLKPISETANSTVFGASFRLPDQHGIFAFRVNYKRPFLTNMDIKEEVTVRHFAHDEWPRSWEISAGWVWIAGIWVTVIGWLAFVALWLWSEPSVDPSHSKKMQ